MSRQRWCVASATVALLLGLAGDAAQPVDLIVLSSNATRAVLEALAPQFEQVAHVSLAFQFANSAETKARIEAGAAFDAAFVTAAIADDLIAQGGVAAASQVTIARAGAGVAIRRGARKPDLSTSNAFKRALLGASSAAYVRQGVTADIMQGIYARREWIW